MFGWIKSKVCGAASYIKEKVVAAKDYVAEKLSDTKTYVAEKCSKIYSAYTGKNKFEQAKQLHEELIDRQKKATADYEKYVDRFTDKIEKTISEINSLKKSLGEEHFQRFVRITQRIASWDIVTSELPESFHYKKVKSENIKSRSELFLIDFDKNPIKSHLKACFTLGFWSRKEATETLHLVQEQEKVLKTEIAKLEAEKTRISLVAESLENIKTYFNSLIKSYGAILDELEYVVNLVASSNLLIHPAYMGNKVDCYLFPKEHILCLMAGDKMTRILHEMTTLQYLSPKGEIIKSDKVRFDEKQHEASAVALRFAA